MGVVEIGSYLAGMLYKTLYVSNAQEVVEIKLARCGILLDSGVGKGKNASVSNYFQFCLSFKNSAEVSVCQFAETKHNKENVKLDTKTKKYIILVLVLYA